MVSIAHLSDPHLGPLPSPSFWELLNKRLIGYLNWQRGRKRFHNRDVANLLIEDLKSTRPDHTVVTGDLVNISLKQEFVTARDWLQSLGSGDTVTVVPGNHDAYVPLSWDDGLARWQDYMISDARGSALFAINERFPFLRIVDDVAIVGLSSAVPMPPYIAAGRLGETQVSWLADLLPKLRERGYLRMVLVHHPPLPGQNITRKALRDADALTAVLERHGAELVLHGHNHMDMITTIDTVDGHAHVIGVPSASGSRHGFRPAAQYNIYHLERDGTRWTCSVDVRGYDPATHTLVPVRTFELFFSPNRQSDGR